MKYVNFGRKLHQLHEKNNLNYIPHTNKGKKIVARKFYSEKFDLSGKIDEAIETDDEIILIERKYSDICEICKFWTKGVFDYISYC